MGLKSEKPKSPRVTQSCETLVSVKNRGDGASSQHANLATGSKKKKKRTKITYSKRKKTPVVEESFPNVAVTPEAEENPTALINEEVFVASIIAEVLETPIKFTQHADEEPHVASPETAIPDPQSTNAEEHVSGSQPEEVPLPVDETHISSVKEPTVVPESPPRETPVGSSERMADPMVTPPVAEEAVIVEEVHEETESDELLANVKAASGSSKKHKKKTVIVIDDSPVKKSVKRKLSADVDVEESEVEPNVPDIVPSAKKRRVGKRIPENVPVAPMDNVSFHSEESVGKWKYVYKRRIAQERELATEVLACQDVMELLEEAGLMQTVVGLGRCFYKLVKEFIVNIYVDCNVSRSPEFHKVFVRGKCIHFSPLVVNSYLGRSSADVVGEEISLDEIAAEITAGQVTHWPSKGLLSSAYLSVKYDILNRIGAAKWPPTKHASNVSYVLAKLIYLIGTHAQIDFGTFVFDQTMRHADSYALKLPIGFPCMISEIILSQHPDILSADESPSVKASPLTIDNRLLIGTHVPDVAGMTAKSHNAGASSSKPNETVIAELMAPKLFKRLSQAAL
ncbi:uncharacterized protein LOC130725353 [Lotus japonicus]|uniref:uncharacterized protein LOC130725353 n=1 Tax=Lotus japonicus TaxID=34305 RepID=UPI00258C399D|nr:uncharacterized protein LOC130725353 [Lotus japonicus]